MKRMYRFTAAFLTAVLVFLSVGCHKAEPIKRSKTYLDLFDTVIEITGYEKDAAQFERVCAEIYALAGQYHALCDIYADHGVIGVKQLNETAMTKPIAVDQKLFALLCFGKEMAIATDGACNIAMGSVLSLWHEARENGILPDETALQKAAAHTDIANLILDEEKQTVYYADAALRLDLGAIAKGYVVERAYELLHDLGKKEGYLLNFGGNIKAVGTKPDQSAWVTGIENPFGDGYLKTVDISEVAVVTSGDKKRGAIIDGVWYHHIIDPKTLFPADYFSQVTVICKDSGVADALSTALYCMDQKSGAALLLKYDAAAIWVYPSGEVISMQDAP